MTQYTREQILSMPAGSELDEIAGVIVMGAKVNTHRNGWIKYGDLSTYPKRYSEDISAAFELVDKLSRGRIDNSFVLEFHYERYYARFGEVPFRPYRHEIFITAPEAITKAAILAMMESGGTEE
ncbi:BC1872 family protein [Paenibacillus taiwanensis]|uniref:BC1872 family protein n=1 Tax=Paenibacillus taiwanensis TaxID=401638 RepID=UPI0004281E4C|nr:hypothetical protein [Paenibacillus taiwanensis]